VVAVGSNTAVAVIGVGARTGTEVDVGSGVDAGTEVPAAATLAATSLPPQAAILSTSKDAEIVTALRNPARISEPSGTRLTEIIYRSHESTLYERRIAERVAILRHSFD
jgi:hypothetical protein